MRADLAERGVDLTAWWRARRWRSLLELIEQLPRASRTRRAMLDDPETARMILDAEDAEDDQEHGPQDAAPWSPPLDQLGLAEELLVIIANQLIAQRAEVARMMTGKGADPKLIGPPRTLVDELRDKRAEVATLVFLSMLMPGYDFQSVGLSPHTE